MTYVQCRATSKRSGVQCQKPVTPGAAVCAMHGSKAPGARDAAERRREVALLEDVARREVGARALTSMGDVYDELLKTAELTIEGRDRLEVIVNGLTEYRYRSLIGTEQIRGELVLFRQALADTVKVLAVIAKLDIQGRRRQMTEREGALVAEAIRRILDELHLTAEQRALVPIVVPRELRRVVEG